MKRSLGYIVPFIILFMLCACSKAPETTTVTGTSSSTAVTSAPSASSSVTTSATTGSTSADAEKVFEYDVDIHSETGEVLDGKKIMVVYDIAVPELDAEGTGFSEDVAASVSGYYASKASDLKYYAEIQLAGLAAENAKELEDDFMPLGLYADYEIKRNDAMVFSVKRIVSESFGGPSPNNICYAESFVSETGELLVMGDIFTVPSQEYLSRIASWVLEECKKLQSEGYGFYEDFEQSILTTHDNKDFYLTENGICFFWQEYTLAPAAAGILEFEIPYEELADIMNSRWTVK